MLTTLTEQEISAANGGPSHVTSLAPALGMALSGAPCHVTTHLKGEAVLASALQKGKLRPGGAVPTAAYLRVAAQQ